MTVNLSSQHTQRSSDFILMADFIVGGGRLVGIRGKGLSCGSLGLRWGGGSIWGGIRVVVREGAEWEGGPGRGGGYERLQGGEKLRVFIMVQSVIVCMWICKHGCVTRSLSGQLPQCPT